MQATNAFVSQSPALVRRKGFMKPAPDNNINKYNSKNAYGYAEAIGYRYVYVYDSRCEQF